MNRTNIQHTINIMKRADKVNMTCWQERATRETINNEAGLHTCGTAACFAGWVAVSPEFQADGGTVAPDGQPILGRDRGEWAISLWLDIDLPKAEDLCAIVIDDSFYGRPVQDVTAEHVIEKLEEMLDAE